MQENQGQASAGSILDVGVTIQVARVLCIFFMMYAHEYFTYAVATSAGTGWAASPSGWLATLLKENFAQASVPLLAIVSGWLQAKTLRNGLLGNVQRKGRSLLLPLIAWNVLMLAAFFVTLDFDRLPVARPGAWANALVAYKSRPANVPLYFLRDLFVCSTAGFVLLRFMPSRTAIWVTTALCATLVVSVPIQPVLLTPMMLPQFLMGIAIQRTWNIAYPRTNLMILLAGCLLLALWWLDPLKLERASEMTFRFACAALMWSAAVLAAAGPAGRLLARLAPALFVVFCSHVITFHFLREALQWLTGGASPPGLAMVYFIAPAIAMATGWCLYLALRTWAPSVLSVLNGGRIGGQPAGSARGGAVSVPTPIS